MIEERHYEEALQKKDSKINKLMLENAALKEKVSMYEKSGGPTFKESQALISNLKLEKVNLLEDIVRKDAEIELLRSRVVGLENAAGNA